MVMSGKYLPTVLLVGAAGGGTGYAMLPDFLFASITFCAACAAGGCVARLFGRKGLTGWGLALLAGCLATLGASGLLGVAFGTRLILEAPMWVFLEIVAHPATLVWWLAAMSGAHLMAQRLPRVSKQ